MLWSVNRQTRGVGKAVCAITAVAAVLALVSASRADAAVYWVNNESFSVAGTIGRVNLDGTGYDPDFIVVGGNRNPCGVAVNERHIYWANSNTNSIGRANVDGSAADQAFISGELGAPCGPSVNSQYIYWANRLGVTIGSTGAIGRANLDGSGVSPANVSGGTAQTPGATALDDDFVYWTNSDVTGTPPIEPTIYRQEFDALPPEVVVSGLSNTFTPNWPSLSPTRLFFATATFGITTTDREGNGAFSVTTGNAAGGTAVHDSKIYWLSLPAGNLSRANLDGSSPEFTLISGLTDPLGLAIDGRSYPPFEFGALRRKKRRGTATLAVVLPEPGRLVLAGKGVKRRVLQAPEGLVKLRIRPKPRARKKLDDTGRARVRAKITHTPDGGEPGTRTKPIKLIQRQ